MKTFDENEIKAKQLLDDLGFNEKQFIMQDMVRPRHDEMFLVNFDKANVCFDIKPTNKSYHLILASYSNNFKPKMFGFKRVCRFVFLDYIGLLDYHDEFTFYLSSFGLATMLNDDYPFYMYKNVEVYVKGKTILVLLSFTHHI